MAVFLNLPLLLIKERLNDLSQSLPTFHQRYNTLKLLFKRYPSL
jgi:hypothetical protein